MPNEAGDFVQMSPPQPHRAECPEMGLFCLPFALEEQLSPAPGPLRARKSVCVDPAAVKGAPAVKEGLRRPAKGRQPPPKRTKTDRAVTNCRRLFGSRRGDFGSIQFSDEKISNSLQFESGEEGEEADSPREEVPMPKVMVWGTAGAQKVAIPQ